MKNINKRFYGIKALSDISLSVMRGTIHGLVGENGAGKSTLAKIISGVISPDDGIVLYNGVPVNYKSPHDALQNGIIMISQEVTLVPQRTVIENVFLGMERNRFGLIWENQMRKRFTELISISGFNLSPDIPVRNLSIADQKKVEILKAIARDAQLIIMDEPTAMLSSEETIKLLKIVRELKEAGRTIIYISHFLKEVLSLSDNITVLRNGRVIKTAPAFSETEDSLIKAMIGKEIVNVFPEKTMPSRNAPVVLSVEGLSSKRKFKDVTFSIRAGEILGIAGLVGSGRSEVARAIFGADSVDQGTVKIYGKKVEIRHPGDAIRAGIALLPESRKLQGLIMGLNVAHNVTLPHLGRVSTLSYIKRNYERTQVQELLEELDVRPRNPGIKIANLSGGNQQKVLFAKWLFNRPRVLIADEPTSGVDIGAKQAIYQLIVQLAKAGMAVLLISSELEEVLGLADRVIAMRLGRIVAEFDKPPFSKDDVMYAIFSSVERDELL
ncbi:sugar ABC transporter ATP-binding protein [Desulfofundulus sp.]|uniref:sugar ABC transporter ATP-binding protein n=1 Tax=Desulfofundulus sp. TaxID=2282750 RepID=UPI003C788BF7